ncbi:MAG: hypothetical protein AAGA85_13740 [Bacteroidota bacterium]
MEELIDLAKILAPAALVLYLAYLLVRSFLNNQLEEIRQRMTQKGQEVAMPIRLQAYERVCLLLERVAPDNLIPRLNNSEYTAGQFRQILLTEVREEFNHNLSQQVYMSDEAWSYVKSAVEDTLSMINEAGNNVESDEKSLALAKKIFDLSIERKPDMHTTALLFVKDEARKLF